jgi:hypothetical protein
MAMPEKKKTKPQTKASDGKPRRATPRNVREPSRATTAEPRQSTAVTNIRRGDRIVVDSSQVGSPPREGEIPRVMTSELAVSYEVRWTDGHQSVISPAAGAARIVRPGR